MDHSEGVTQASAGTVVPQELLEEMLWFFRVEDASPWNYSIFALMAMVIVISMVLLGKSIQANRKHPPRKDNSETKNQKKLGKNKRKEQIPEVQYLAEAGTKDNNNLNILREAPLSEKLDLAQAEIELRERGVSLVLLPDPQESES